MSVFTSTTAYRWPAFVGMAIWLSATLAIEAVGDEPTRAFRRVLVPAESPETWPRDGQSLLPVEAHEFEGWVQAANARPSPASIVAAEYRARFEDDALVDTRGTWHVELPGDRAARLTLGGSTIAIRSVNWRGGNRAAARLGWWPAQDGGGFSRALEVPASGVVDFEWDLKPPVTDSTSQRFLLEFPTSARTRLELDLPAGKRPVVQMGTVVESPPPTSATSDRGKWVIALPTAGPHLLTIEDADGEESAAKTTIARQTVQYRVHRGGLDLEATLNLSANEPLPKSIVVTLPVGMSVISATADGQTLDWRASSRRVTIQLPAAVSEYHAAIVLRAWGPLVLDEPQRLPMLALRDSFWASGVIELAVDDLLELCDVAPTDCIQTPVEALDPTPPSPRRLTFAAYAPGAALEITLRHRQSTGTVQSATSLVLGNPEIAGKVNSLVGVERGRLHRLTAELRSGWVVDALETAPADALGEWYVDRTADPQLLCLQLDRAIVPGDPVRVFATVHSTAAATDSIPIADLEPLDWQHLQSDAKLLELWPAEQYDLEVHGKWRELSTDQVSSTQRELLSGEVGGRLAIVEQESSATIRRVPKRIAYDATIEIEAALVNGHCEVSYEVTCIPRGGGIDHALVFLPEPSTTKIQWIEAESQRVLNVTKMPTSDPRMGGLPAGGGLYRLDFGRLYARPIHILAKRSIPWNDRRAVPLVSLPDAASQQGLLTVASAGNNLPEVSAENMSPAPFPWQSRIASVVNSSLETRAVFRFQPTRFYDAASPPHLWIAPVDLGSSAQMIAARIDVESRYSLDGHGVHRAIYQLSNQGATAFAFTLAEGTRLTAALVDGIAVPISESLGNITLPTPPQQREVVAELQLTSQAPPLSNGVALRSPLPATENALLTGSWRVKLPSGFAATDPAAEAPASSGDWRSRLFGPLARRTDRPFNPFDVSDWNQLWIAGSGIATPTARAASNVAPATAEPPMPDGMAMYQFAFGSSPTPRIVVSHWQSTTAVALAIGLLAAAGTQLARVCLRTRFALALASAAVSLLAPAEWAPLATGAALGFVAAALWQRMQPATRARAATIALLVAGCMIPSVAHAAPDRPAIESVLVPVDGDGKPAGSKYFVSEHFLREVLAQSEAASASGRWLCAEMRCEGQLVPTADRKGLTVGAWRLTVECEVFGRDVTLSLPLLRNEASWQPAASVDGMPAPILWSDSGRGCSIRVAEPGHHQISLTFQPNSRTIGSLRELSLHLPPIQGAQVIVTAPIQAGEVSSQDTSLVKLDQPQQALWRGQLSADGQFSLSWANDLAVDTGIAKRQVTQTSRLRIAPSGLILELQLVERSSDQWPESIQVAIDAGWQLAPNQAWLAESTQMLPDGCKLLDLPIPSAARGEPQHTLRFIAPDRSPLGRLRPPTIELKSLPLDMRLLVVTSDPSFECLPSEPIGDAATLTPELAAALRAVEDRRPTAIVNLDQIPRDWHLVVRPVAAQSTIRSRVSIAAGVDRLRIHFHTDVDSQGTNRFGSSLSVPDDLLIHSLTANERGEPLPLEWVRVSPERVNVFFDRAAADNYRIELRGEMRMTGDGLASVPRIAPPETSDSSQTIALYRDDNVAAQWRFPAEPPWVESGAILTNPFDAGTHFVRAYPDDEVADEGIRVAVERAEPVLTGAALTRIARDGNSWEAIWSCRLRVDSGTIDVLRLQAPQSWSGPFEVAPTAKTQLESPSNAGKDAMLAVRLQQPAQVGDEIRLTIRSPLAAPDGQRISAPRIRLLAEGRRSDYLSLPTQLAGEPLIWTRSGVEAAELPAALSESAFESDANLVYRVANNEIDVTLRPQPLRADLASVRLAETSSFTGDTSDLHATRFLLSPAGLDRCDIRIDKPQSLVRVSVNGHPALQRQLDSRLVQVQLDHSTLPQVLDIVVQSDRTQDQPNQVTLVQPALEQAGRAIPVDLSLWTIHGRFAGLRPNPSGCTSISPAQLASMRLDWMANISQNATRTALEVPAVDGYSWFLDWASRLRTAGRLAESAPQALADVQAPIRVSQSSPQSSEETLSQAEAWIDQMAEFFRATELPRSSDALGVDEVYSLEQPSIGGAGSVPCFVSEGGRDSLEVEFLAEEWTSAQSRFFALGSLAVVAMLAVWVSRRPSLRPLAEGWPETWGLLIGLVAWAWMRPSIVGLLIAVVSVALLVRRIQREKKSPRHDSSKPPNSVPNEVA
jgi:hypothetical protein